MFLARVPGQFPSCLALLLFFHSHMLLILDFFDKIIENRCTCSFYGHFCVKKIQKLLAQSLPKQFAGNYKQIKIQQVKCILAR